MPAILPLYFSVLKALQPKTEKIKNSVLGRWVTLLTKKTIYLQQVQS